MSNRIVGAIGVLWGGGILASHFLREQPQGQGAYAQGQTFGLVFGLLLFAAGLYYLVKGKGVKAS